MITFQRLRFKNFLSTGNVFTEIEFTKDQNTLIIGTNGSGKSTFIDALSFTLFGKPFRSVNKPQLVNSINDKDCLAELEFTNGHHQFLIRRGIKPTIFEIYVDDVMINQDAASMDYQEHLEKNILKFNYKSFKQVIALGSSSFTPFMQLKSRDRREIIEDLLDLRIFSTMNGLLKARTSDLKSTVTDLKYKYDLTESKIVSFEKLIKRSEANHGDTIKSIQKEIAKIKKEGISKKNEITKLRQKIDTFDIFKEEKIKIADSVSNVKADIMANNRGISDIDKDLTFFETNEICPVCSQEIDENHKHDIIESNTKKKEEIALLNANLKKKGFDLKKKIDDISMKIDEVNKLNTNVNILLGELKTSASYMKSLTVQLDELESKDVSIEDKQELDNLKNTLDSLEADLIEKKNEISVQIVALDLLKDSGIKSKIINQYVPMINTLANKFLASMDFFVQFELDENFNETIRSRYRDQFSYASFSEGEKMRIDLSLLLTWRAIARMKNSVKTNLLILDEVFDSSLDDQGVDDVMKLLQSIDGNVFLISHKGDLLNDKFENTIKFIKPTNYSIIDATTN